MGMPTPTSINVPYVAYGSAGSISFGALPDHELLLCGIDYWEEKHDKDVPDTVDIGNGWTVTRGDYCLATVERDGTYPTVIRKGDMTVYFLNVSQYAHVGEAEVNYFADDKEHLQAFLTDIGQGDSVIYADKIVSQWA
jgi:hypothetical protein